MEESCQVVVQSYDAALMVAVWVLVGIITGIIIEKKMGGGKRGGD